MINWRASLNGLQQRILKALDDYPALQAVPYWLAAFLVGLIAVAYTSIFHHLGELTRYLIENYRFWTLLFLPASFVSGWWVVRRFAPLAVGSGIPQVMAALELEPAHYTKKLDYLLGLRTFSVKIVSSFLCALGGASVGPEGPAIQICAGLFHFVGKRFQKIWPQIGHESLILAGGAAGVAAAFNTPLGGIVFAIEELSHSHFHKVKTALISAVIIAGLVAQWIKGSYLFIGYPVLQSTGNIFFIWAIVVGLVTGVSGALFSKLVIGGASRFAKFSFREQLLFNFLVSAGIIVFCCYFGTYSAGSGIPLISDLLFKPNFEVTWATTVGRFIFPILSYMAGGAAGLLAPALAMGAVLGRQMNEIFSANFPNLMVLLGMIGFLSAFTRAPFTAFVLVVEMTDRHSAIFFMMITSLIASAVSRGLGGKSLYENRKELYLNAANQAALRTELPVEPEADSPATEKTKPAD